MEMDATKKVQITGISLKALFCTGVSFFRYWVCNPVTCSEFPTPFFLEFWVRVNKLFFFACYSLFALLLSNLHPEVKCQSTPISGSTTRLPGVGGCYSSNLKHTNNLSILYRATYSQRPEEGLACLTLAGKINASQMKSRDVPAL